jgi:hypothetical protein
MCDQFPSHPDAIRLLRDNQNGFSIQELTLHSPRWILSFSFPTHPLLSSFPAVPCRLSVFTESTFKAPEPAIGSFLAAKTDFQYFVAGVVRAG